MDGYSVKEAATVLGVPKRRVWELIARGVLWGAPEGDGGMRVFLQPRPGQGSPLSADRQDPPRINGNGGHAEAGEGSPFREILTEFRSLTERYGQALLALGEARGEVAALRSRVELLEARLDLRLPGPRTSSTVAWEMPEYIPPAPPTPEAPVPSEPAEASVETDGEASEGDEPVAAEAIEPTLTAEAAAPEAFDEAKPEKAASRRRRALRSYSALAGFAEALERAQDPTLADLPGAREAAEALAALQRDVEARAETDEAEAPPIEADALATEAAVTLEPEAEPESEAMPEPDAQPEPMAEASFVEPAAATSAHELVEAELAADAPDVSASRAPEPAVETAEQPEPVVDSTSHYTTEVVEPDWFADGDFTWLESDQAASAETASAEPETAVAEPDQVASADPETVALEPDQVASAEAERAEPDAAPAAEDFRDAFEPAEVGSSEPEAAVTEPEAVMAGATEELPEAERQPVTAGIAEWVDDQAETAATSSEAIQDAFDETYGIGEPATAEPEMVVVEADQVASAEVESAEREWAEPESAPAEAIQDAFEPAAVAEPEAAVTEPEAVMAEAEAAVTEPEAVMAEAGAAEDQAETEPQPVETVEVQAEIEATPSEAIQDVFDETYHVGEPARAEAEPVSESAVAEPATAGMAAGPPTNEQEAIADLTEWQHEPIQEAPIEAQVAPEEPDEIDLEALPAADAIQDAFDETYEAPDATPAATPTPEISAATPTAHEEPFAPADVAVFAVDRSAADTAEIPRDEGESRPPEARAQRTSIEPPPIQPRSGGPGGLAVQAAAPPTVPAAPPAMQAIPPATAQPGEEELMWLGDEFEAAELEIAATGWHREPEAPAAPPAAGSVEISQIPPLEPSHEVAAHGMSDADLQQIAEDEGWDADEVEAIRTLLGRPTTAQPPEEADAEPAAHQATAFSVETALPPDDMHPMDEVHAGSSDPAIQQPVVMDEPPTVLEPEPMASVEWPMADSPRPEPEPPHAISVEESIRQSLASQPAERPAERRPAAGDPDWLRRRRGPAARAYRRLRRLLP